MIDSTTDGNLYCVLQLLCAETTTPASPLEAHLKATPPKGSQGNFYNFDLPFCLVIDTVPDDIRPKTDTDTNVL